MLLDCGSDRVVARATHLPHADIPSHRETAVKRGSNRASQLASMATKPKPRETVIFLSSTFRDFAPHRQVLKLALESSDYRVLGMELFTASANPPLKTCFDELKRSTIYIGVIGEYYGSCPPGFKKSYTQLEYEA